MATRYDTEERIKISNVIIDAVKMHLQNSSEKTMIDFGCATGLIGLPLAEHLKSIRLIDVSSQMIHFVKNKIEIQGIKNAEAICTDLETQDSIIEPADCIIAVQVLLHIKDTKDILKKLYSLLRPGGQLIIVDFIKNNNVESQLVHNGFVQEELESLLREIGFHTTSVETCYNGEKIFMGKDASLFLLDAGR